MGTKGLRITTWYVNSALHSRNEHPASRAMVWFQAWVTPPPRQIKPHAILSPTRINLTPSLAAGVTRFSQESPCLSRAQFDSKPHSGTPRATSRFPFISRHRSNLGPTCIGSVANEERCTLYGSLRPDGFLPNCGFGNPRPSRVRPKRSQLATKAVQSSPSRAPTALP